ncbi:MAG: hypothetical protein COX52_13475 [Syntrophobacterales bacterium CG23_combo_of_CG06-09_8_20_14_all_48_27]|nr:MAG: hypothetical protein COX52_13475 [Syntrophobacterales bacterium CG23_combo_of_CG06-09_8_20_14_all_48_27]
MRALMTIMALMLLVGCAPIQLKPQVTDQVLYITPIDGASAQIIVPEAFQTAIIRQKPSFGKAWAIREFEIYVGNPLTKGILSHVQSLIPQTRIGNTDDGKPSSITLKPSVTLLEFGVDDSTYFNRVGWIGILAAGSDTVVASRIVLAVEISVNDGPKKLITVEGSASKTIAFITISESDLTEMIGASINDAAQKVGYLVLAELKKRGP